MADGLCPNGVCPAGYCKCPAGTYKSNVPDEAPIEGRLPTVSFPKAPDPSPFRVGPMTPGGRE